jgi:predicted transcriptional regulator of viral defense system
MVISSISTRKTTSFKTPLGKYIYHAIRSDLFFGYKIETFKGMNIKIADPAKTILDFLYLSPKLNSEEDFFELRLNFWEIQEKLNLTHFEKYLSLFSNKALEKRADIFIQFLEKNDVFS